MLEHALVPAFAIILALGTAWLLLVNLRKFIENRNGVWHPWYDGKMRRRANGGWEYRDMTRDEMKDDNSSAAW